MGQVKRDKELHESIFTLLQSLQSIDIEATVRGIDPNAMNTLGDSITTLKSNLYMVSEIEPCDLEGLPIDVLAAMVTSLDALKEAWDAVGSRPTQFGVGSKWTNDTRDL